jgi:hypothetical protein
MPDGQSAAETSSPGKSDAHRTDLKQHAEGLFRRLSEFFAYLTHGTASLKEARKLLSIITNVSIIMFRVLITYTFHDFMCIQLDFKLADIKHSSLRTMARHVRRAMLQGNHEVFKRSFAEGHLPTPTPHPPPPVLLPLMLHHCG